LTTVRWKRNRFKIAAHPLTHRMFERWVDEEGRNALRSELRRTRWRWFFGGQRAEARLYRRARIAFAQRGTFSAAMCRKLDRFPVAVRTSAVTIQRAGYMHLCTYDQEKYLIVVPRGVVFLEFKNWLLKELVSLPQVSDFQGLTEHVVTSAAVEAELAFFEYVNRGKPFVDENGHGLILQTDRDFRWRINNYDGHYCYALSLDDKLDLTRRRERRAFMAAIDEPARGQNVYLRRLRPEDVRDTADLFQIKRMAGGERRPVARRRSQEPVLVD